MAAKKKKKAKKKLLTENDIALDLATEMYKKFSDIIKAIAMFGSTTKGTQTKKSDIDIIVIVDDCTVNWDQELIGWYREELARIVKKHPYGNKFHINTITLSVFWDEVRRGEPLVVNIIRFGHPLVDAGNFFDPLKVLLAKGKITPSPEAVFITAQRAFEHQANAKQNMLVAFENYYWSMVEAAQAALMALNILPPSPEEIPHHLQQLVKQKKLKKQYLTSFQQVEKVMQKIKRKEVVKITGQNLDECAHKAEQFVDTFQRLTKLLLENKRIIRTRKV